MSIQDLYECHARRVQNRPENFAANVSRFEQTNQFAQNVSRSANKKISTKLNEIH